MDVFQTLHVLLVVEDADYPTRDNLCVGESGNKMMDSINYERYSVIRQKHFKVKADNNVTNGALPPSGTSSSSSSFFLLLQVLHGPCALS